MKKLLRACALVAAFISSGAASAAATDYAIGTDLIRWSDPAQSNGMANLVFQKALGREDALYVDFAMKDERYMLGIDYKVYNQRYYYGSFMQLGGLLVVDDGSATVGIEGAMGYEFSPAQNWVVSGDVQMIYGPKHPVKDSEVPWFTPRLRVMYTF
jgi:hypothetical protein